MGILTSGADNVTVGEGLVGKHNGGATHSWKGITLDGAAGYDTLIVQDYYPTASHFSVTSDALGVVTLTTASGNMKIKNFEKIQFSNLSIKLGTAAADSIVGSSKDDKFLFGLGGNDIINGGAGNDKIDGGRGKDSLTGSTGKDVFDFNSIYDTGKTTATRDVIKDFAHLSDKIDLYTIDANGSAAGLGTFKFQTTKGAAFTGVAGQLHFKTWGTHVMVEGDINGDKVADFQIEVYGTTTLSAGDFVL